MRHFAAILLAVLVGTGWAGAEQKAGATAGTQDTRVTIVGVWRGHSECTDKNSPCHDEVNVYRFSQVEGKADTFMVTASKVVDGKEIVMGSSVWKYDDAKKAVECEQPAIRLAIEGKKMEGALRLADGTVYRRIYLMKES